VVAYQYDPVDFLKFPKGERNVSSSVFETIPVRGYKTLLNASMVSLSFDHMSIVNLRYKMENDVSVLLFKVSGARFEEVDYYIKNYIEYGSCSYCTILAKSEHELDYTSHVGDDDRYVVVAVNRNNTPATIYGSQWYTSCFRAMDKSKAIKICKESCTFDHADVTRIVAVYPDDEALEATRFDEIWEDDFGWLVVLCIFPSMVILFSDLIIVLFTFRLGVPSSSDFGGGSGGGGGVEMKTPQPTGAETAGNSDPVSPNVPFPGQTYDISPTV